MNLIEIIGQIDWQKKSNRIIARTLVDDAVEYMKRVEAHIYQGNEIRADMFMGRDEKQDEISRLDRRRTDAHNKMLTSFYPFLDLLKEQRYFAENDYKLSNRTQIADFVALIAFELMGMEPSSRSEGSIRDELAEKLHRNELTYGQIKAELDRLFSDGSKLPL